MCNAVSDGACAPPALSVAFASLAPAAAATEPGEALRPLRSSPRFVTGSTAVWGHSHAESTTAARTPLSSLAHSFDDLDMVSPASGPCGCAVGDAEDDASSLESAKRKATVGGLSPAALAQRTGASARGSAGTPAGTAPKRSRRSSADGEIDSVRASGVQRRSVSGTDSGIGSSGAHAGGRWRPTDGRGWT